MKSFERDEKFSRYTAAGNDNPVWKGQSILDLLKTVIASPDATEAQKERAAGILAYCSRKRKWAALHPELDAYEGILRIDATALWDLYPEWESFMDKDGVERVRHIESEVITTPTTKVLEPEVAPEPVEIEPTAPMTSAQKNAAAIAAAREQTCGLIPSLNF
jgi:hypothetical protein